MFSFSQFVAEITLAGQIPLGYAAITDGGCSLIDAAYCVNPIAKPLFIIGGISNLGCGTCLFVAFSFSMLCPPGAIAIGVAAASLRKIGQYAVNTGNRMEPRS